MKNTVKILIIYFVLSFGNISFAQKPEFEKVFNSRDVQNVEFNKKELKKNYYQATYYLYNDQVDEALILFAKMALNDPSNSNLLYHVGLCYYLKGNYPASKKYFIIASESTSKKYRDNVFERSAPPEVFNYLEEIERVTEKN